MRVVLTSLALSCSLLVACGGVDLRRDVEPLRFERPFEVFAYSADPGFGYCVEPGELERMVLRWESDRLRVHAFLHREEEGSGVEPDVDVLLSAEMSRRLATRIDAVEVIDDDDHGCPGGALAFDDPVEREEGAGEDTIVRQFSFEDDVVTSDHRCRIDRFYLDYEEINVGNCTAIRHYTPQDAARILDWLRAIAP